MSQPLPPAGWYPDPAGTPGLLRYWDGLAWGAGLRHVGTRLPGDVPPPPEPQPQIGPAWGTYWSDLRVSAQTLRTSPYLVLLTVGLYLLLYLGAHDTIRPRAVSSLVLLAVEVFFIGFFGAQRVWLSRRLNGEPFKAGEAWTMPWQFFGRFLCLELLSGAVFLVFAAPYFVAVSHQHTTAGASVHVSPWFTANVLAGTFLGDMALTFVVPALALNVRSVKTAIRLGWRTTKSSWPTNAWYVFAPGISLLAFAALFTKSLASLPAYLSVAAASALVNLWLKCAIVSFYIRSVEPASKDGSASL